MTKTGPSRSGPVEPGLTVAVTGPTGEIGIAFLQALERSEKVATVRGMARRPFDPQARGLTKTEYVQGDVLDREAIDRLVDGADVVVHLAFLIFGNPKQSREINAPRSWVDQALRRWSRTSPYIGTPSALPSVLRSLVDRLPQPGPVILDPGTPLQIVHADDVADALVKAVEGQGSPGYYNLAAEGEFTMSDLARELGWRSIPVPDVAVDLTAELVKLLPAMPSQAAWIQTARIPVVMDTSRARGTRAS